MTEEELRRARHPVVLTGVMRGRRVIELDEESFLPDGYRVTLHLIVEPAEALTLCAGAWADMTPEEVADFEAHVSELEGRPFKLPEPDPS